MAESLNGKLLIASPSMADYFHRTVILMVEHSEEGAFGLVLNRPSETTVGEASPELAELIGDDHLLHVGGPVQPNAVTAIGEHSGSDRGDQADRRGCRDGGPRRSAGALRLRVFVGYAGWGPGQLDGELEQEAWIVERDPSRRSLRRRRPLGRVLARKGGEYALLARMPPDPSVN